jgi:hypothetical protein
MVVAAVPEVGLSDHPMQTVGSYLMSKKTKKKKARMRRSKANHGKRPNMGR